MTDTELALDQLQAVACGATAMEYGLMAALVAPMDNTGEAGMVCKVPPSLATPQDWLDSRLINHDDFL